MVGVSHPPSLPPNPRTGGNYPAISSVSSKVIPSATILVWSIFVSNIGRCFQIYLGGRYNRPECSRQTIFQAAANPPACTDSKFFCALGVLGHIQLGNLQKAVVSAPIFGVIGGLYQ